MKLRIKPLKCLLVACVAMVGACGGGNDNTRDASAAPVDDATSPAESAAPVEIA